MVDQQDRPQQAEPAAQAWAVPGPDGKSVRKAIVGLAGPMAVAEIASLLALVGVVALMGRMGDEALYVRALYLPVGTLFGAVYFFFGFSNQVAAAISRGRGRPEDVVPIGLSFVRLWAVGAVALIAVAVVTAPLLADIFQVAPESRADFVSFVRWMAVAELTQVSFVLCASSLRGFGHATAGAAVSLLSAAIQFFGVLWLGLGLGMGPASVPIAIVVSSIAGSALGLWLLRRANLWRAGQPRPWRRDSLTYLRQVGLPVAASQIILFIGVFGMLWVLGPFGPHVVSGFSAATSLQFLIIMPGIVLGSAIGIVLNQQRGAGKIDWLRNTLWRGLEITLAVYVVLGVLMWFGSDVLGRVMTDSPTVAAETSLYLHTVALTYVLMGLTLTGLTVMEQIGAGLLAVVLNFVYFAAIVILGKLAVDAFGEPVAFYRTVGLCNLAGITVVLTAIYAVRRASQGRPIGGRAAEAPG